MKTRAEIQKEYRARKKAPVASHLNAKVSVPQGTDGAPMGMEELTRMVLALDGYRKAQEKRIQDLEDGAARARQEEPRSGVETLAGIERPGPHPLPFAANPAMSEAWRLYNRQATSIVLHEEGGAIGPDSSAYRGPDPSQMTAQQLADWVARHGPFPGVMGDLEAS